MGGVNFGDVDGVEDVVRPFYVRPGASFGLCGLRVEPFRAWRWDIVNRDVVNNCRVGDFVFGVTVFGEYVTNLGDSCVCFFGSDLVGDWSCTDFCEFLVYAGSACCNLGQVLPIFSWRGAHWTLCDYIVRKQDRRCVANSPSRPYYQTSYGCAPAVLLATLVDGFWSVSAANFNDAEWWCGLPGLRRKEAYVDAVYQKTVAVTLCRVTVLGGVKPGALAS